MAINQCHNSRMKRAIEQILADNLKSLMDGHPQFTSQHLIANKSKVAQSTVGRIMRAETSATIDNVEAIAKIFGLTAADLLQDPDESPLFVAFTRFLQLPKDDQAHILKTIDLLASKSGSLKTRKSHEIGTSSVDSKKRA